MVVKKYFVSYWCRPEGISGWVSWIMSVECARESRRYEKPTNFTGLWSAGQIQMKRFGQCSLHRPGGCKVCKAIVASKPVKGCLFILAMPWSPVPIHPLHTRFMNGTNGKNMVLGDGLHMKGAYSPIACWKYIQQWVGFFSLFV